MPLPGEQSATGQPDGQSGAGDWSRNWFAVSSGELAW